MVHQYCEEGDLKDEKVEQEDERKRRRQSLKQVLRQP